MPALALVALAALAAPPFALPSPPEPEPLVVKERGEGPRYFRLLPPATTLVGGLGAGLQLRPRPLITGGPVAFTVHGELGVARQLDRESRFSASLLAGYSFAAFSEHLFTVGPGLTARLPARVSDDAVEVGVLTSWVVGTSSGQFVQGLRVGLAATWKLVRAELRYVHLLGLSADWGAVGLSVGFGWLGATS